jgi:hypothetical protein
VSIVTTIGDASSTGAGKPRPLAPDELMRLDVLDCDGSCHKELSIKSDGAFRILYGTGEANAGVFSADDFKPTRDRIAETNFAELRKAVSQSCVDAAENYYTLEHFQFRTGHGVEAVDACGPAPGGSPLLAGVMVLGTEAAPR